MPLATPPTTGRATSKPRLKNPASKPLRNLLRILRPPSALPDRLMSSSVFKKSGNTSKESDNVARPSGVIRVSYPTAASAVVPANLVLFLSIARPAALSPNDSADFRNLLFDGLAMRPALATEPARPSQPAMGINPKPKATISSVISPAAVLGLRSLFFLNSSKDSVTPRE